MQKKFLSFLKTEGGAALLCVFIALLWSAPVMLAGRLWNVLPHLAARNYAATGLFRFADSLGRILSPSLLAEQGLPSAGDGRLSTVYIAWLSQWIAWDNSAMWAMAGAFTLAIGLWFFWKTVAVKFGSSTAFIALVITALLPVYWREAVWFDNYNLAFMFLFAAMAAFVTFWPKRPWLAIALSGLAMGLSVSAKDVFLVFVPWIGLTFLWKKEWQKGVVFFGLMFLMYLVPYVEDIRTLGYPVNQNIARVWPGADEIANETYLHLYPDPYTYQFDKERFDREFIDSAKRKSFAARMTDEKVILSYGLEDSLWRRVRFGAWRMLNDVPAFFQRQTVGGVFMWLFFLSGGLLLWRRDKTLALWLFGLIFSMYFGIRFILLYEREHIMNIAWVPGLLAALGVRQIAMWIDKSALHLRFSIVAIICVSLASLQLLQANRYEFARRYRESNTDATLAMTEAVRTTPEDAVIALGDGPLIADRVALLSSRTIVLLNQKTLDLAVQEKNVESIVELYGITHAIGYEESFGEPVVTLFPVPVSSNGISYHASWLIKLLR